MGEKGLCKLNKKMTKEETSVNSSNKTQCLNSVEIHNTLKDISGLLYCLIRSKVKLRSDRPTKLKSIKLDKLRN
jgi:hypothetical protein